MSWCFAIVNKQLAEIYFKEGKAPEVWGHCYVKKNEYKSKQEQNWIQKDIEKVQLIYRKGKYTKIIQ